ncbi:response regulator [Filimonas effusa]|uniref:Response regulator transcription factor n=1 Tax=Filimonas effusa TaxID=2508721 RepID=A0A4Q1D9Z8_9BACT|nr:response regulator [Filimonas effusa]RXK85718.1 response regulator transcription factor [Filimonas effusa]
MIQKVLIAEDHESANLSLQRTLEELGIGSPDYVYYCDDALARIERSKKNDESYDLLITDLYFEPDHNKQKIPGGAELITAARQVQQDLRILVFSAESGGAVIKRLFDELEIDGYVRKARNDAKELKQAIESISKNQIYYPRHLRQKAESENCFNFNDFDIAVIQALADGTPQKDIPLHLQQKKIHPSSLSSIEKRLNVIKSSLEMSKNEQLIAYCKDMGVI